MPQVSGRALSESLQRAVDSQSRVANAAREAAEQARQDRMAQASSEPERDLETGGPKVPGQPGNGTPSEG